MTIFRADPENEAPWVVNPTGKRKLDQLAIMKSLEKFGLLDTYQDPDFYGFQQDVIDRTGPDVVEESEILDGNYGDVRGDHDDLAEASADLVEADKLLDSRIIDRGEGLGSGLVMTGDDKEGVDITEFYGVDDKGREYDDEGELVFEEEFPGRTQTASENLVADLREANSDNVRELQRSSDYIKELMSDSPEAMAALGMSPVGKHKIPTEQLETPSSPREREWWESQGLTGDKEIKKGTGAGTGKRPELGHTVDTRSKGLQEEFDARPEYLANRDKYNQKISGEDGKFQQWENTDEEVASMAAKQNAADERWAAAIAEDPSLADLKEVNAEDLIATEDGAYEFASEAKAAGGRGAFAGLEDAAKSVAEKLFGGGASSNAVEGALGETQKWKDIAAAGVPMMADVKKRLSRNPHRGKQENRRAIAAALKSGNLKELYANRELYDNVATEGADLRKIEGYGDIASSMSDSFDTLTKLEHAKVGDRKKIAAEAFGAMSNEDFAAFGADEASYLKDNKNVNIEYEKEKRRREAAGAKASLDAEDRAGATAERNSRIKKNEAAARKSDRKGKGKKGNKNEQKMHQNALTQAQRSVGNLNRMFDLGAITSLDRSTGIRGEFDKVLDELQVLKDIPQGENSKEIGAKLNALQKKAQKLYQKAFDMLDIETQKEVTKKINERGGGIFQ